MNVSWNSCVK